MKIFKNQKTKNNSKLDKPKTRVLYPKCFLLFSTNDEEYEIAGVIENAEDIGASAINTSWLNEYHRKYGNGYYVTASGALDDMSVMQAHFKYHMDITDEYECVSMARARCPYLKGEYKNTAPSEDIISFHIVYKPTFWLD